MSFWVNLGENLEKPTVIFEISNFKFIKCKVSCKTKSFEFRTKSALFGHFYLVTFRSEFGKTTVMLDINTFEFF